MKNSFISIGLVMFIIFPSICSAQQSSTNAPTSKKRSSSVSATTTQIGTTGPAGSSTVNQTTTVPIYQGNGYSVDVYSSTTVTGGASTDGSGNPIPNGTRGSSSNTTKGVGVTIPFKK